MGLYNFKAQFVPKILAGEKTHTMDAHRVHFPGNQFLLRWAGERRAVGLNYRILQGDVLDRLRELPDESVHCVVTSPPYWGLRDYGVPGQLGLEGTPQQYVANMVAVFRDVRRVLRKDGTAWVNMGDCYATGAGKVGECPGGGEQGARWTGEISRVRDDKRGYRGDRLANGRGDQPAVLRNKTRATMDGTHAGKNTAMAAIGPMTQPNRMRLPGLKPKDMVGIPWRLAFALQADGWWLRQDIIWHKPNPMPESATDRCTKAHEYIFLLSKSRIYHYDADAIREDSVEGYRINPNAEAMAGRKASSTAMWRNAGDRLTEVERGHDQSDSTRDPEWKRNKRSVWTVGTQSFEESHFATFPEELIVPCILAGCPVGGTVLDPFSGSGTTGVVALRYHRKYIGIELSAEYAAMSERRISGDAPLFNKGEVTA